MSPRGFKRQTLLPSMILGRRRAWFVLPGLVLMLLVASCGGSGSGTTPPPPPTSSVTVTPQTLTLTTGASQQFSATVKGETSQQVSWKVNGSWGGNATYGFVSQDGVYVAPSTVPPATVLIAGLAGPTASFSFWPLSLLGLLLLSPEYEALHR